MRQRYPRDRRIDLLKANESRRYAANPERLREEVEAEGPGPGGRIVIDEVQKVPALLDEAHWLLENRGLRFALCGSSARKVRRGAANPLGGRAVRYELHGLTADELADGFDLSRMLNHGYLREAEAFLAGDAGQRARREADQEPPGARSAELEN